MCGSLETKLAQNESCVFEDHMQSLFYEYAEPVMHWQEYIKQEGESSH